MKRAFVVLGLALGFASACGGDGDEASGSSVALCREASARFEECGFTVTGECSADALEEWEEACITRCMLEAECGSLVSLYCDMDFEDGDPAVQCVLGCLDGEEFECADGSGTYLESDRCDMFADCDDASDEAECAVFTCDSGFTIAADEQCDGFVDCGDESDEAGCPTFHCLDGVTSVPEDYVCDGFADCFDDSDEADCPESARLRAVCPGEPPP